MWLWCGSSQRNLIQSSPLTFALVAGLVHVLLCRALNGFAYFVSSPRRRRGRSSSREKFPRSSPRSLARSRRRGQRRKVRHRHAPLRQNRQRPRRHRRIPRILCPEAAADSRCYRFGSASGVTRSTTTRAGRSPSSTRRYKREETRREFGGEGRSKGRKALEHPLYRWLQLSGRFLPESGPAGLKGVCVFMLLVCLCLD